MGDFVRVRVCAFVITTLFFFLLAGRAPAQSTFGTITGTVSDSSGGVLAGANVEARNQETGLARTVQTDEQGYYRFINMDPGVYTITASMDKFATLENKDVVLDAREVVESNFRLTARSASSETIIVEANQEVVSQQLTESTSRSGDEISDLPLNFRATNAPSPIETAALTPGVKQDAGGNLTFSGQLTTATSFSLDGISIQNVRYGGPSTNLYPSVEGIAEFRVNTAANSAEFAQPTDLTIVTKSGTNQFHGGGFWYFTRAEEYYGRHRSLQPESQRPTRSAHRSVVPSSKRSCFSTSTTKACAWIKPL